MHWSTHKNVCKDMAERIEFYSSCLSVSKPDHSQKDSMRYSFMCAFLEMCMHDLLKPMVMPHDFNVSMASPSSRIYDAMKEHSASDCIFLFHRAVNRAVNAAENNHYALCYHMLDFEKVLGYFADKRDKAIQELLRARNSPINRYVSDDIDLSEYMESRKRRAKYWVELHGAMAHYKGTKDKFRNVCGRDWAPALYAFSTDSVPLMMWAVFKNGSPVMVPIQTAENHNDTAGDTKRSPDSPNERKQSAAGR